MLPDRFNSKMQMSIKKSFLYSSVELISIEITQCKKADKKKKSEKIKRMSAMCGTI